MVSWSEKGNAKPYPMTSINQDTSGSLVKVEGLIWLGEARPNCEATVLTTDITTLGINSVKIDERDKTDKIDEMN